MEQATPGRRPTKLVLAGVGLFVLAVFLGRLLVAGGVGWLVFALAVPVTLVVLSRLAGWRGAFVLTLFFALAVVAARWFVQVNPTGWAALLLLPVVAFTVVIVARVLGKLREPAPEESDPVAPDEPKGP